MKKLLLLSILVLFANAGVSFAAETATKNEEKKGIAVQEATQNQNSIWEDAKTIFKSKKAKFKEKLKVIPQKWNKKQGLALAIVFMVVGLGLLLGSLIGMTGAGMTTIIILLVLAFVGLALWLIGILHLRKLKAK